MKIKEAVQMGMVEFYKGTIYQQSDVIESHVIELLMLRFKFAIARACEEDEIKSLKELYKEITGRDL